MAPLLAVAALFAYHNSLQGAFIMDDLPAIPENATIRTLWPPAGVFSPPADTAVAGRPFVNLTLALNYALGGLDVTSYHLFNVAVHLIAALVLFAIVRRTLASPKMGEGDRADATAIGGAAALLWVVHPLTSESVNYTIQRTELLMGLFFLLSLYFSLRGFEAPLRRRWHAAALGAFALGLASKEVIVVLPAVVLAYDWLFCSRTLKEALRRHRCLYVGFAAVLVLFIVVVGTRLRHAFTGRGFQVSPWHYALTETGVIVRYLRLALWPYPLAADYDGWPIATSIASVLASLVVVVALFALTAWGLASRQKLAFLGIWFFLILAPTSSFRPLPAEIAAERRMYLPLAPVVVLFVLGVRALSRPLGAPRVAVLALVAALAATLAFVTVRRNDVYRNPMTFWTDIVSKRPDNPRGRMSLGYYLYKQGRRAEALAQLTEAVRIQPENGEARYSLGVVLASQGRTQEAIAQYREAIRIDPRHPRARFNFARALTQQGRTREAIEQLEAAVRLNPNFAVARRLLTELRRSPVQR